jgi:ribosomal protein S6
MSEWTPISQVAKDYNKHVVTLKRWCADGFILRLGFRVKKDPKGRWFLMDVSTEQTVQSKHNPLQR